MKRSLSVRLIRGHFCSQNYSVFGEKPYLSFWFINSALYLTKPIWGLDFNILLSNISLRPRNVSPGLTGFFQFEAPWPGDPMTVSKDKIVSCIIPSQIKAVCHPLEIKPSKIVFSPTSSLRWKGKGLYFSAKLLISDNVKVFFPSAKASPVWKSLANLDTLLLDVPFHPSSTTQSPAQWRFKSSGPHPRCQLRCRRVGSRHKLA